MIATAEGTTPKKAKSIPQHLVKEAFGGYTFYYKGYREVLNGKKTLEEIMGCSPLQATIIEYLMLYVCAKLDLKKYRIFTNEAGNHLAHKENMAFDIAVYEKAILTPDKIDRRYVQAIPPKLVVEIDNDIELAGTGLAFVEEYMMLKTNRLFQFGAERVVWVLSKPKKVVIAGKNSTWQAYDWNIDLELLDGVMFNIAQYLEDEGISLDI